MLPTHGSLPFTHLQQCSWQNISLSIYSLPFCSHLDESLPASSDLDLNQML
ncbi:hypothetical protein ABG768_009767, partial [Culter alburnus]